MTIGRVAEMLGEDEDQLQHLAMDMDPEDGCLSIYGTNNLSTTAFTPTGIEFLRQMILDRKTSARPRVRNTQHRGIGRMLTERFGLAASKRAQREPPRFTAAALDTLLAYHWPGNVRELRNLVEVAVLMSLCGVIGIDDLPAEFLATTTRLPAAASCSTDLRSVERVAIAAAVHACGGNYTKAAKRLGIACSTLYMRVAAFDLAEVARARDLSGS